MILLELYTKSGACYTVNVVHHRIRRTGPDGDQGDWREYVELHEGEVGQELDIYWPGNDTPTITTPVVKITFLEVE